MEKQISVGDEVVVVEAYVPAHGFLSNAAAVVREVCGSAIRVIMATPGNGSLDCWCDIKQLRVD